MSSIPYTITVSLAVAISIFTDNNIYVDTNNTQSHNINNKKQYNNIIYMQLLCVYIALMVKFFSPVSQYSCGKNSKRKEKKEI